MKGTDPMVFPISTEGVVIDHSFYRVLDLPDIEKIQAEGPSLLMKAVAYRIDTPLFRGLYPYRGLIDHDPPYELKRIGIYLKKIRGKYKILYSPPKTKEEKEKYALEAASNIAVAMVNQNIPQERLTNIASLVGVEGDKFHPPIRTEDDPLNKMMKLAIRKKNAPFEPFGKLLEISESRNGSTAEGINAKNNAKRGLLNNTAMSSSKFALYANIWGLDYAILIKDSEDSIYPIFEDEKDILIYYPNGNKFPIDPSHLIDASTGIEDAILETSNNEENEEDT